MNKPIVFARMSYEDVDLIKEVCRLRGEDLSDFVRRSIKMELARLSYLSDKERKALGLSYNNSSKISDLDSNLSNDQLSKGESEK